MVMGDGAIVGEIIKELVSCRHVVIDDRHVVIDDRHVVNDDRHLSSFIVN